MKKSILALSLLVGLSAAASSYAALPETVRIGTDTTYAPFSSKDAKGDFVGFDIDLGNEMCKRMQVKCTWVASDFDALIPSLKAKKIDAIISSLSRPGVAKAWMWWPMPTRIWFIPIWLQDVWMLRYKMKLLPVKDSSSNLLVKISPLLAHQ